MSGIGARYFTEWPHVEPMPYACALTEAGEADCWAAQTRLLPAPDPPPARYTAVVDATFHTCALTDAGEILCWGWNHGRG